MERVRVRFAPSPTGYLHVGGARTALYNWLFARHAGGTFVLRIEDTDKERSTGEYLDAIIEDLRWLGLDWDEGPEVGGAHGPYFQSERGSTYAPYVERLLSSGAAYHCFCTPEELEARRGESGAGAGWRYDRKCRSLSEGERRRLASEGRAPSVRFRVPDGVTRFRDLVLGEITFDNSEFDDLVIARPGGTPTYNFAATVDDLEMDISHVVRGSDHLTNTPKQILLWEALGKNPPVFAHLPLVLAEDRQPLSKRRGAVAIGEYRRIGYLPEALVNTIALLGWSYDGTQEFFTREELVTCFEIARVGRKAAAFDPEKLQWMNAQWLKRLDVKERTDRVVPFLVSAGLLAAQPAGDERRWLEDIVALIDDRLKTLVDILDFSWFFLASDLDYDSIAAKEVLDRPGTGDILAGLSGVLGELPDFDPATLERAIRGYAETRGLSAGKVIQPLRVAVTGKTASPGMFETLSLLGREKVLARVERVRTFA
jgi:glutamyl-tRNA synthetase